MGGVENIGDKKQISLLYSPYSHAPAYTMRPVDMSSHVIIKPGLDWPFNTEVPNSKNMIPLLERNESLVTWLQPCKGEIKDQFPVIKMGSRYYTLSLRQMKVTLFCVWCVSNEFMCSPTGAMEARTLEEELYKSRNDSPCGR